MFLHSETLLASQAKGGHFGSVLPLFPLYIWVPFKPPHLSIDTEPDLLWVTWKCYTEQNSVGSRNPTPPPQHREAGKVSCVPWRSTLVLSPVAVIKMP